MGASSSSNAHTAPCFCDLGPRFSSSGTKTYSRLKSNTSAVTPSAFTLADLFPMEASGAADSGCRTVAKVQCLGGVLKSKKCRNRMAYGSSSRVWQLKERDSTHHGAMSTCDVILVPPRDVAAEKSHTVNPQHCCINRLESAGDGSKTTRQKSRVQLCDADPYAMKSQVGIDSTPLEELQTLGVGVCVWGGGGGGWRPGRPSVRMNPRGRQPEFVGLDSGTSASI
eukprot:SAG11_NODE_1028_length_6123_cov_1.537517_6_plen_225_part_00